MGMPKNVRIERPNGTMIPCQLRHEGYDEDENMDNWVVVTDAVFRPGIDKLHVGTLPARTSISFPVGDD